MRLRLRCSATEKPLKVLNGLQGRLGGFPFRLRIEQRLLFCLGLAIAGRRANQSLLQLRPYLNRLGMFVWNVLAYHHQAHLEDRVATVRLVDDLLKLVMGDDCKPVHGGHAGTLAIWQAEATANRLLDQRPRVKRP